MEKVNELQMTVEEIVRSYREAKDKAAQVGILAALKVEYDEKVAALNDKIYAAERALELL